LYLPHLRRGVYQAIVELEGRLDACAPRAPRFQEDTDLDGIEEMYLQNGVIQAVLKLDGTGSVCELDSYRLHHNFGDTLRRQAEYYYRKIEQGEYGSGVAGANGIASAHDRVGLKHEINASDMGADDHARGMFIDRFQGQFINYRLQDTDQGAHFRADAPMCLADKKFLLSNGCLTVSYVLTAEKGMFETEINVAMPSCDGWGGRYIHQGQIIGGFGQHLELPGWTDIILDDGALPGRIVLKASAPVTLRAQPYHSVSQSEGGFEKIMQGVTITLEWTVSVREVAISMEISPEPRHGNAIGQGASEIQA
jgi:4-alpha-glucanotransferase/alpha-amylase